MIATMVVALDEGGYLPFEITRQEVVLEQDAVLQPHPRSCFFKQPQFQRLFGDDLLQIARLAAEYLDLIGGGGSRGIPGQPPLAGFEELLRLIVIQPLGDRYSDLLLCVPVCE